MKPEMREAVNSAKLVTVNTLPKPHHGRISQYASLVEGFLANKSPIMLIEMDWPENVTNGEIECVINGIKACAKRFGKGIVVVKREGDVYMIAESHIQRLVETGHIALPKRIKT
jgi:hypothetical protein